MCEGQSKGTGKGRPVCGGQSKGTGTGRPRGGKEIRGGVGQRSTPYPMMGQ